MLWKSVTALIVVFWVTMTTLLVQTTYFSEESTSKPMPVNEVLSRIVQHQDFAGGSDTLQLMHDGQGRGLASLAIKPWQSDSEPKVSGYSWHAGGHVNGPETGGANIGWSFDGNLSSEQRWQMMHLTVHSPENQTDIEVSWKIGDDMPKIEVTREGKLVMDTKGALEQAKKEGPGALGGGFAAMMPGFLGSQKISLERIIQMDAKSEMINVGDRRMRGMSLRLAAFALLQAKARFTDNGELIEVELPNHWRLVDLMVLGMEPGKQKS